MKQLEVNIMGQTYILGCPEGHETELLEAVGHVDREMCAVREAGKIKSRERIAVLTALNLAYQLARQHSSDPSVHPALTPSIPPAPPSSVDLDALIKRIEATLASSSPPA